MLDNSRSGPLEVSTGVSGGHLHHHLISGPMSPELPKSSNMPMDVNIYATRKTVAQGMMDIALMTANASQLKFILINSSNHRYFAVSLSLLTISIILQIVVGIILIFLGRWNINFRGDHRKAENANNAVLILIFLITIVNIMITSFAPNPDEGRILGPNPSITNSP
ncbi:ninjurin-2 isoform X2 [Tetranychus urticae]|uniref:Ninjurin-1-like n=2 Tax=Tetranychus urticae TaxID=32264 RepID=T1KWW8_TETUR|nr:ninjurin-2 isoform X2 [Tetranychus urticae]